MTFSQGGLAVREAGDEVLVEDVAIACASAQVHQDLIACDGVGPRAECVCGFEMAPKSDHNFLHDLICFLA
jgi:hypothetical protein